MTFFLGLAILAVAVVIILELADVHEGPSVAVVGRIPRLGPRWEVDAAPNGRCTRVDCGVRSRFTFLSHFH